MTSPAIQLAIQLAKECGDVETDRRGRETYTFDCYGVERLIKKAKAQALRDAADEVDKIDEDFVASWLRRMAEELEKCS